LEDRLTYILMIVQSRSTQKSR